MMSHKENIWMRFILISNKLPQICSTTTAFTLKSPAWRIEEQIGKTEPQGMNALILKRRETTQADCNESPKQTGSMSSPFTLIQADKHRAVIALLLPHMDRRNMASPNGRFVHLCLHPKDRASEGGGGNSQRCYQTAGSHLGFRGYWDIEERTLRLVLS